MFHLNSLNSSLRSKVVCQLYFVHVLYFSTFLIHLSSDEAGHSVYIYKGRGSGFVSCPRKKGTKFPSATALQLAVSNIKTHRSIWCDLKTRRLFFVKEAVHTNLLSLFQFLRISPNFQRFISILKRDEKQLRTINEKTQRKLEKINNRLIFKFVGKNWLSSFVPRLEKNVVLTLVLKTPIILI